MSLSSYLPTSPTGLAMRKLARMVALSAAFQGRCGVSETGALERTHILSCDADSEMPFALVSVAPGEWKTLSGGAQNHMRPAGSQLLLMLQCEPASDIPATNPNDRRLEAYDFFESVVKDVAGLSAADDPLSEDGTSHLAINRITPDGFSQETPEHLQDASGVLYWASYVFDWGYEG